MFVVEYYINIYYIDLKIIYCIWFFLNLNFKFNDVLLKKYVGILVINNIYYGFNYCFCGYLFKI